jgi:hypothetical protein
MAMPGAKVIAVKLMADKLLSQEMLRVSPGCQDAMMPGGRCLPFGLSSQPRGCPLSVEFLPRTTGHDD